MFRCRGVEEAKLDAPPRVSNLAGGSALKRKMNPFGSKAMRRVVLIGVVAVAVIAVGPVGVSSAAKPPPTPKPPKPKPPPAGGAGQLSIAASPRVVVFGEGSTVSGQLTGVPSAGGTALSIDQSPYPFKSFTALASGSTGGSGTYSFAVTPGRNTRYRVTAKTSPPTTSAEIVVLVK